MITDDRGFWLNENGEYVHPDMVKADDKLKNEVVGGLLQSALSMQEQIRAFKKQSFNGVNGFFGKLLKEYGVDAKAKKGNITLKDFSGLNKVQISVAHKLEFDEKLQIVKMKIDEYLKEITKDSSKDIQTIITKAFEVDGEGAISVNKILPLKRYAIDHPKWIEAMKLLDESLNIASSKSYIRFYTRAKNDEPWQSVKIDIASL